MLDVIPDKRIVMALSGHKTSAMLDHYAKHIEEEKTLEIVRKAMKELFTDNENDSVENALKQAFNEKNQLRTEEIKWVFLIRQKKQTIKTMQKLK